MKKLVGIFLILFLFVGIAHAYELDGSMDNNGDGTYSVTLNNQNGHEYNGTATDNGDGTMSVSVQDYNGESYSGTASNNGDGSYDLDLQNDSSGGSASGTVDIND